jgi:hypothetical protein
VRTIEDVTDRLRAEYLEMPGLQLKPDQVQRLCGIEQSICQLVLDTLVSLKFLCVRVDGRYVRLTEGYTGRLRPVKADLARARPSRKTA